MPLFTVTNSYVPSAFDVRVNSTPVAVFVRVTLAFGITAPDVSRIVPTTEAVSNCAKAVDAVAMDRNNTVASTRMGAPPKPVVGCSRTSLAAGCYDETTILSRPDYVGGSAFN